jgi:hypothetical protein
MLRQHQGPSRGDKVDDQHRPVGGQVGQELGEVLE